MEGDVVAGRITQEAFNIVEKAVKNGKLGEQPKFSSDLEDVYATEAANAVKEKGIKLFDVNATKPDFVEKFDTINSFASSLMAGQGVRYLSDLAMDKVSKKAKRNALMELYKDDKVMLDRIKNGYYSDKKLDQLFKDNVNRIIRMNKS